MNWKIWTVVLALSLLFSAQAFAKNTVERYAFILSSNNGGAQRVELKYAHKDADALASVLTQLGGTPKQNIVRLKEASPKEVQARFNQLQKKMTRARASQKRVELVFYYSGHATPNGILLNSEKLSFLNLQTMLKQLPTDMRLVIIDSCHAGAFTRVKGGRKAPGFLHTAPNQIRGHAIITSSAANEVSQESDRIKASFFTHAMITALRGAADKNGDKRITLNEAYQFAFQETVARTQTSSAGAQHPEYNIKMTGRGDYVLTQLKNTSGLVFVPKSVHGTLVIRAMESGALLVETKKAPNTEMHLALPRGKYDVYLTQNKRVSRARFIVTGQRQTLRPSQFTKVKLEPTVIRGSTPTHPSDSTDPLIAGVDFLPHVGTSSHDQWRRRARLFSLNLIGGRAGGLSGLEIGGLFNWHDGPVNGVQIGGLLNTNRGSVFGLQLAGLANLSPEGDTQGIQIGGLMNTSGGDTTGLQIGGVLNLAHHGAMRGVQIGGILNTAQRVKGLQIGLINWSEGPVQGAQVGLVNFASTSTMSLGLVNIFSDGWTQLETTLSADGLMLAGVRHGGDRFYTLVSIGAHPIKQMSFAYGFALGWVLFEGQRLSLSMDVGGAQIIEGFTKWSKPLTQLRIRPLLGVKVFDDIELIGGPTAVIGLTNCACQDNRTPLWRVKTWESDLLVQMWPGLVVGARF